MSARPRPLGRRLASRPGPLVLAVALVLAGPVRSVVYADVPAPDTGRSGTGRTAASGAPAPAAASGGTSESTAGSGAQAAGPSVMERVLAGIRRVGPVSATITREARDLALANVMIFARAARAVPANLGDGVVGFRLFGIRTGSVLASLGLRNGDFLRSINGRPISTPQEALAAYSGLRSASVWVLRVQRGDADATLDVRVVDGAVATPDPTPSATPPAGAPAADSATTPARSARRASASNMRPTMAEPPR